MELEQFQIYLSDCRIIVYDVLSPDKVIFSGNLLRTRNCICYMIWTLRTTMSLRISKLLLPKSTYDRYIF